MSKNFMKTTQSYTRTNITTEGTVAKATNEVFSIVDSLKEQKMVEAHNLQYLSLDDLILNPLNTIYRELTTQNDIRVLADTIAISRLIDAIQVIPNMDMTYRIVSGENRYLALKMLKEEGQDIYPDGVPAIILPFNISVTEEMILIHAGNLVRRKFSDIIHMKLIADFEQNLKKYENEGGPKVKFINKLLSSLTGLNIRTVRRYRSFNEKLIDELYNDLIEGRITQPEAEEYTQLAEEDQLFVHQKLREDKKVSLAELRLIKNSNAKSPELLMAVTDVQYLDDTSDNSYTEKPTSQKKKDTECLPMASDVNTNITSNQIVTNEVLDDVKKKYELDKAFKSVHKSIYNYMRKEDDYYALYGKRSDNYEMFKKIINEVVAIFT